MPEVVIEFPIDYPETEWLERGQVSLRIQNSIGWFTVNVYSPDRLAYEMSAQLEFCGEWSETNVLVIEDLARVAILAIFNRFLTRLLLIFARISKRITRMRIESRCVARLPGDSSPKPTPCHTAPDMRSSRRMCT